MLFSDACGCFADENIACKLQLHAKDWLLHPQKTFFFFLRLEAKTMCGGLLSSI